MSQPFKRHHQFQNRERQRQIRPRYDDQSQHFTPQSNDGLSVSQQHSHPNNDFDPTLDAFGKFKLQKAMRRLSREDRQLLSEFPAQHQTDADQHERRFTLPPLRHDIEPTRHVEQAFRSDLHDLSLPACHNASSPSALVSSPTVAALQNRHVHRQKRHLEETFAADAPAKRRSTGGQYGQATEQENLCHAPPVIRGIQLICTSDMPDRIRTVFPYEVLNAVQSKCFHPAFESDDNLVVSAPTGSGKTAIMELAICRLMMQSTNDNFKVIYQAPTKSLCSERYQDWEKKFKLLGLGCAELTGDTDYDHLRMVQQASIIITTPEKWDSVTRKWRDNIRLIQMIKLFLVDEVHILKDQRGATLEAVVSRMKSMGTAVRFVALSATVPNSEDIATWLGKNPCSPAIPARREVFDEGFRPVRLEKHVFGFRYGNNDFGLDSLLRKQVSSIILNHGRKKPTMVFCMTRNSAFHTAQELARFWRNSPPHQQLWPAPTLRQAIVVRDTNLRDAVQAGVAFHHGGLSADDRRAVEQGFLQGRISVICSTSTLAVGVNLPCYLVVLQGTNTWTNGGIKSYSDLEVMQMLGRAGRPQFEASACAVILTREQHASHYEKMVSGQELLESTLHGNLIEHLNAEIGLGTITDLTSAQRWLSSTFLRVRVARNPAHYRLEGGNHVSDTNELMRRLCEKDVQLLLEANMIEGQGRIKCTELGNAMAKYYVNFEIMKLFAAIPPRARVSEILSVLTQAAEFAEMRIRGGEKSYYKELNRKVDIMHPVNVDIALPEHKVSIILQAELGGASPPDGDNFRKHHQQHHTDRAVIFSHANRLIRCIIDCQIFMKDAGSVRSALELGRSIAAKAWESTPRQLKQLPEIGDVSCRKLASHEINSIEKLLGKEAHQLEMCLNKSAPFGARLLNMLQSFPRLHVSIKEMGREQKQGQGVVINVRAEIGFLNETPPNIFNRTLVYVCFMLEDSNGHLIDFRRFGARKLGRVEQIFLGARVDSPITYFRCHVMCDEIVGTARSAELKVNLPASAFPASAKNKPPPGAQRLSCTINSHASTFDDDGIADDDLITAAAPSDIEAVDDIDEVLLAAEKLSQQDRKHTLQSISYPSVDEQAPEWIEPTQLPNGRWTCQHLCKQKGLACKHKCCREGVAKPKKKLQAGTKTIQPDPKQRKITGRCGASKSRSNADTDDDKENRVPSSIEAIMASLRQSKGKEKLALTRVTKAAAPERTDLADFPDVEDDMFDDEVDGISYAMDCDWNVDGSSHASRKAITRTKSHNDTIAAQIVRDDEEIPIGAPLTHVSLQDVQLQPDMPFCVAEQSSSPKKQSEVNADRSSTGTARENGRTFCEQNPVDDEDKLSQLSAFSDLISLPDVQSRRQSAAHKVFRYVPMNDDHTRDMFLQESEEETAQRLHEEDQKRRWDGLPQWMYDEFHAFTELID